MKMKTIRMIFMVLSLGAGLVQAKSVEQRGLEIAVEMDKRDTGYVDQSADMSMMLRNKQGEESQRRMRSRTLEVQGDGDKSVIIFDAPADVKGAAFLSYTHAVKPDDQWLYLSALKRVKRISSANKSGPFMGSEFAYEDLTSQEVDKYDYKYLRDETLDGRDTFVMERYPRYEKSGYTRQVVWVDKKYYQPLQVEFYDLKNSLLKTLTLSDYHQYLDKYWRASHMKMVNKQTGRETELSWEQYRFRTGLSSNDFHKSALQRMQ